MGLPNNYVTAPEFLGEVAQKLEFTTISLITSRFLGINRYYI